LSFDNNNESAVSLLMRRRLSNRRDEKDNTENSNVVKGDVLMSERPPKLGTVSIPSPGVPENMPLNLDVELCSLAFDDSVEEGGCR
jgi:hypothetical protein